MSEQPNLEVRTFCLRKMLKRLYDLQDALQVYPQWSEVELEIQRGSVYSQWKGEISFEYLPKVETLYPEYWSDIFQGEPIGLSRIRNGLAAFRFRGRNLYVYKTSTINPANPKDLEEVLDSIPNIIRLEATRLVRYVMPVRNRVKLDNNMKIVPEVIKYSMYFQRFNDNPQPSPENALRFVTLDEAYSAALKELTPPVHRGDTLIQSDAPYDSKINYMRKGNIIFPKPQQITQPYAVASFGIYSSEAGNKLFISPISALTFANRYAPIYEEALLTVPYLNHKYIKINGVSFLSRDLRLLYNTFLFETLVYTNESDITFPTLRYSDLLLLRDMFAGMSPMLYVYEHLSEYAYNQLSGERTMFSIYDEIVVRIAIDKAYSPGAILRDQLKQAVIPKEIGRIVRLEELSRIASE